MVVALSVLGSAISLFSCRSQQVEEQTINYETFRTEYSENMSIVMSENGRKSYHFETPLIEGYNMAKDPYREFRKGIKITTFEDIREGFSYGESHVCDSVLFCVGSLYLAGNLLSLGV